MSEARASINLDKMSIGTRSEFGTICYIALKDLKLMMSVKVYKKFNTFLQGQTTLALDNGDDGIYLSDLKTFLLHLRKGVI